MHKVLNSGNKSQGSGMADSDLDSKPHTSNYRRQGSLRHSQYYGYPDNYATIGSLKQGGKANLVKSKKYTSCENVRHVIEEYQDVIEEESSDDENGLKEKIAKRYNSLTTLLMKSFRKAKIKKKKEAMMNDSVRSEIYDEKSVASPRANGEQHNSRPSNVPILPPRHDNPKKNKFSDVSSQPVPTCSKSQPVSKKKFSHAYNQKSSDENKKSHDQQDSDDSGDSPNGSMPVFLGVKMISNEFVDLKQTLEKKTIQSQIASSSGESCELNFRPITEKRVNESINQDKKIQCYQEPSLNQTLLSVINDSVEKKKIDGSKIVLSSANKPQAPKAPVQNSETAQPISSGQKPNLSVKRAKTFTQQLQEILLERKQNSSRAQNEQSKDTISLPESVYESGKQEKSQPMSNKSLGYYDTINSVKSLYQDLDDSKYVKQIKNFNESSLLKESLFNELSISTYSNDESSDDFKDLVQVLARQDNLFKKKFFDCLMTKLWDTTLPYNEYLQLNKLMSALFGENYHKLDTSFLNSATQNKTTKLNSEQVVNLVKMFLDSSNGESLPSRSNEELNFEYFSVANLISTLKRRQKNDNLSLEVQNFNSHFNKLISSENQCAKSGPNLEIEKIKFLNGINTLQNSSLGKQMYERQNDMVQNVTENKVDYFLRNRFRNTMGNIDSLLAQYSCGNGRPMQKIAADSSISFPGLKYSTLQRDESKPSSLKPIVLNTSAKSNAIVASFQPSQFIAQESKRSPSVTKEIPQTFTASKVISLNKQCPPKPKVSTSETEATNPKMNKIRSVKELFKNDETPANFPKKNDITMVKAENLVYAQFEKRKPSEASTHSTKTLLSTSIDRKSMSKSISSSYTMPSKPHGIYSTLGSKKDASDIVYYHPNQFKLNCLDKISHLTSNKNSKESRIYESKSTKNYQIFAKTDKIYDKRKLNQTFY